MKKGLFLLLAVITVSLFSCSGSINDPNNPILNEPVLSEMIANSPTLNLSFSYSTPKDSTSSIVNKLIFGKITFNEFYKSYPALKTNRYCFAPFYTYIKNEFNTKTKQNTSVEWTSNQTYSMPHTTLEIFIGSMEPYLNIPEDRTNEYIDHKIYTYTLKSYTVKVSPAQ